MEQNEIRSRGSILTPFLALAIIGTLAYSGWMFYQKGKVEKELVATQQVIENQEGSENQEDSQEVSLQNKKFFLENKMAERILWTNVMTRYEETIDSEGKIDTNNFTGNQDGNLSFSASTTRTSLDPYLDTATLIAKFKQKPFFKNIFIPSISSSVTEQGEEFLNYTIRVDYEKSEIDQELLEPTNTVDSSSDTEPDNEAITDILESLRSRTSSTSTEPETSDDSENTSDETPTEETNPTE